MQRTRTGEPIPPVLATFRRGFVEGDVDLVLGVLSDDWVYTDPFGTFHGKASMKRYCQASFERFRDITMEVLHVVSNGEYIGVEWTFGMTGDVEPIAGRRVEITGAGMLTTRDGLLTSWHDYWDSAPVLLELGIASFEVLNG